MADVYEMSELRPGNLVKGPAVVEATNTTLPIPKAGTVKIDKHNVLWCKW